MNSGVPLDPIEGEPSKYGLPGVWLIGHEPEDASQWALEARLRVDNVARIRRPSEETEKWATGQRPETEREWKLEYTFRQLENQRTNDIQEKELRYRVILDAARQSARGEAVRSWVLLAIVVAIIAMPIIGMSIGIQAQTFSQFIAPITGIGGTVLGYWFGQRTSGETPGPVSTSFADKIAEAPSYPELPPSP